MQSLLFQFADSSGIPTFEQAISALGPIPLMLYRALEFGTIQNRAFFDQLSQKEMPRPHIREMIVRDQAKRHLERNSIEVEEDKLAVGSEPLVALLFRYRGMQIRILKGRKGILPGCGTSRNRKRFYGQLPTPYLDAAQRARKTRLNLILLWDFDPSFNLAQIWLVCPRTGGKTSRDVTWFWHEPIPHPAASVRPTEANTNEHATDDKELEDFLRGGTEQDEGDESKEA